MANRMTLPGRREAVALLAGLLLAACECGPGSGGDGGATRDGGTTPDGGAVVLCEAARDCDDGLFCTGVEACRPGDAQAGSDGCAPGTPPCSAAACDEAGDACNCGDAGDSDGDGHDSLACGGDDCDDDDAERFPGNTEVCDASHDEDCLPTTLGGLDADSDGFVAVACCNGDACGDDCDDSNGNINPGAGEVCDGVDNDCDGSADQSTSSLCPGGTCSGGMCQLDSWARTFGGELDDVDMDVGANVVVVGSFDGTTDFGAGPVSSEGLDPLVVAYGPSGLLRWQRTFGFDGADRAERVAMDDAGRVYIQVNWDGGSGPIDFGGGPRSRPGENDASALVALSVADGEYLWDVALPPGGPYDVSATADGVVVVVSGGAFDYGTGELAMGTHLVRYSSTGDVVWAQLITTGDFSARAVDVRAGVVLVGGFVGDPVDLGGGELPAGNVVDMGLARYRTVDGTHLWSASYPSSGRTILRGVTVAATGDFCAGGRFSGDLTLTPEITRSAEEGEAGVDGYVVCFDDLGEYLWDRVIPGTSSEDVNGLASDSTGDVFAVGQFSGTVNLGGGVVSTAASTTGFTARYTSAGLHRSDSIFAGDESNATAVAVGFADSTVVIGAFAGMVDLAGTSRSGGGAFVLRLAR